MMMIIIDSTYDIQNIPVFSLTLISFEDLIVRREVKIPIDNTDRVASNPSLAPRVHYKAR